MAATIPVTTQQSDQILMDTSDIVGYNVNWNGIQLQGFITMMHDILQAQYEPSNYTDLYIDNCVINFLNAYYTYCENNSLINQLNEIDRMIDYVTNNWSDDDINDDDDYDYDGDDDGAGDDDDDEGYDTENLEADINDNFVDYVENAYDGNNNDNDSVDTISDDGNESIRTLSDDDDSFSICSNADNDPFIVV